MSLVSMQLPAGSILVSMKGTLRWITPELCAMAVRRSQVPQAPVVAVDLDFREGEEVEIMDLATSEWRRARVTAVCEASGALPKGTLAVQVGHTTCSIVPEMFGKLVRKLEDWTPDGEEAPEVAQVASGGSEELDAVSQGSGALSVASVVSGREEVSGEDGVEAEDGAKDVVDVVDVVEVKAEKDEDSMSKASSDGTTASGKVTPLPSLSASPQLAPSSRPPSPTGSSSSVRPTVSLRIPEMRPQSPAPRPSTPITRSPSGTPRRGAGVATVEGPAYDRGEQRLLVVGPGFGRELNPQQGCLALTFSC